MTENDLEKKQLPIYLQADCVDCASIDSFPASDPPGWTTAGSFTTPETVADAKKKMSRKRR